MVKAVFFTPEAELTLFHVHYIDRQNVAK